MNSIASARRVVRALLASAVLGMPVFSLAEDIDIYAGMSATSDLPNVLILLDSSSNWSTNIPGAANCFYNENGIPTTTGPVEQGTKLGIEQCALYNLIDGLPVTSTGGALFRIAISLMNESPDNGNYPRKHFTDLTTANKAGLKSLIASFNKNGDKGNNADYGLGMYEAHQYYKGLAPLNGTKGSKWDAAAVTGGRYNSPSRSSCGRNYIIVIGNGSPQNSAGENSVQGLLAALPANAKGAPDTAQIAIPAAGNDAANWSDEMARYLRYVDVSGKEDVQGIITHAVAVIKGSSDGGFPPLMNSIANHGGGSYYEATNADVLLKSFKDIFNQIVAVNSVFASASLPVSVNLQGTYQNQVFMGMFRPDKDAKPRWVGNMKQYKFGLDALGKLYLADSANASAISSSTGFITPSAVSYWTTASDFWKNNPSGNPVSGSDSPDGEVVEKGAAGQRLRIAYADATSRALRKVLTCVGCASTSVPLLGTGSTAATLFNTGNTALSSLSPELINWVRGADNKGDELGPDPSKSTIDVRPSIHGDVLHSRPAVVDYGGSTGVVVFYGGNDGMLHAIKGNQSSTDGGDELWSFVPEEMFPKLNRLYANTPEIRLSTTPATAIATPRDYFVDGPVTVYRKVVSGGTTKVFIYVGMRRGGRQIYAFDVTNPAAPIFAWKKTNADLPALGQTWSAPKVARIKSRTNPVLVFGGGYDAAAEDSSSAGSTTMGNAVYVLDAFTGTPLQTISTGIGRSVAADVTLVDSDYDLQVDRIYAVDLGGQVYRIDTENSAGAALGDGNWTMFKLADLSGGTSTGRKFFFGPDVVLTGSFAALSFGSGDREKPLLSATQDHFFQIFDKMPKGTPGSFTPIAFGSLVGAATEVSSIPDSGCYVTLDQGEKVVNAAASIGGSAFFGTNRPINTASATSCTENLGLAKSYEMPLFCITPTSSVIAGGGLPPGPVVGIVGITKASGQTVLKTFVIGAPNEKQSGIEVSEPAPPTGHPRKRRYWYQEVSR